MDILNPSSNRFFDDEKNVREYIESCEGIDGRALIETLKKHLKPKSSILELGMGAGKDLDILNENFNATGSDYSKNFIKIYKQRNLEANLLLLDAVTLDTTRKFDCIYSNKVLHHLSPQNLIKSLKRQKHLLTKDGILFHTFWTGNKRERFKDLHFIQYTMDNLLEVTSPTYAMCETNFYEEMNINDSIYIILKPH